MALTSVAWVCIAISTLSLFGLDGAFGRHMDGLVTLALAYGTANLVLFVMGTLLMYRPGNRGYVR